MQNQGVYRWNNKPKNVRGTTMTTKYRAAALPGLSHCSILRLFFILSALSFFPFFRDTVNGYIDSPPQCYHFRKRPCTNHPSNRRNNTRLWLFISFSFFFSLSPVILVALSMDFNAECNKLRPREGWERASDGLKARAGGESHFSSLRLRLFLTRLNATLDDDKFTGVAGELIVPRFRTTIYQRYP